jgi:RNA polymerase-associated protein RTF1
MSGPDLIYCSSSGHSSPASMRSAPMDQSDSESDNGAYQDDDDKYPLEGKFINAADKADILSMNEVKREEILAERAQEVERDRQNRALKLLLKAREADNKQNDKKRKAGAADLESDQRKISRQRTKAGGKVGESSSGFDNLKRARAEKNDRQRRREEENERNKDRRATHGQQSSREASPESEVEWDAPSKNKKSKSPDHRDTEPLTLHDIERTRVGRSRFAMVCFYPGFDEAITGCFVRISIGQDKETGANIYRMAIIKGIVEAEDTFFSLSLTCMKGLRRIDHMPLRLQMESTSKQPNMYALLMGLRSGIGLL